MPQDSDLIICDDFPSDPPTPEQRVQLQSWWEDQEPMFTREMIERVTVPDDDFRRVYLNEWTPPSEHAQGEAVDVSLEDATELAQRDFGADLAEQLVEAMEQLQEQRSQYQDAVMAEWFAAIRERHAAVNDEEAMNLNTEAFHDRAHRNLDLMDVGPDSTDDHETAGTLSTDELLDLIDETLTEYREERDA